jgi:hypothetical protein
MDEQDTQIVEPDVWVTQPDPDDPSLNADPTDEAGAHDHPDDGEVTP